MLHHFIVLGVAVCVGVLCTYSYSFLFDSPYWQYFASEWHFTSHGYVMTHWLVGCQGQQCCDNGAASAWSILGSCPLETRDSYRQTDRNNHCCSRIFSNVQIYALLLLHTYDVFSVACYLVVSINNLKRSCRVNNQSFIYSTVLPWLPQEHEGAGGSWLGRDFLVLWSSERLWQRLKQSLHFPS